MKYNHIEYFDNICQKLKFFNPGREQNEQVFFTSPNSDNLMAVSQQFSSIDYPFMVAIDGLDSDFKNNRADLTLKNGEYFVLILDIAQGDNAEQIMRVQKECEKQALQIQAQMLHDHANLFNGLQMLDENSFTIRSVGPVETSAYGVIMGFRVDTSINLCIDNDLWQ